MALTLRGSMVIPFLETMNPNKRPAGTQKTHLRGAEILLFTLEEDGAKII